MARNDELKLNQSPVTQDADLAGLMLRRPVVLEYAVTADATGGKSITLPFAIQIIDAWVVCTSANASGTLQLRNSTTAITDAMVCAVDKVVVHAGTLDDAQTSVDESDSMNILANGAADRGLMYIMGFRE